MMFVSGMAVVFWHHSHIPCLVGVCVVYSEVSHVRYLRCHVQEYTQHVLQIFYRLSHLYHCFWNGIFLSVTEPGELILQNQMILSQNNGKQSVTFLI